MCEVLQVTTSEGLAQGTYVVARVGFEPVTWKIQRTESITETNVYLSIYGIYIALLQGNYSEALPAQARAKIKVLRGINVLYPIMYRKYVRLFKRNRIICLEFSCKW